MLTERRSQVIESVEMLGHDLNYDEARIGLLPNNLAIAMAW